ncbi:MAG TPA: ParB/RepB/Spo0J family partition protein [Candidatus Paceibacterota bacterium]|nr:ParB/RepB/Spo0J family partition protein [Candidatus Paceibacterota bacterium]HRY77010.1 ParB/RepB/Spo0J family partition protein [Candidatus Paceibacterota bacterium]
MDDNGFNPFIINHNDEPVAQPVADPTPVNNPAPISDLASVSEEKLEALAEQIEEKIDPAEEIKVEPLEPNNSIPEPLEFDSDLGPIKEAVYLIETEKIKPNPQQPRRAFDEMALKELADSIREYGILQPLIVTKIEKEVATGTQVEYQLIAGERRLRAAQLLGLERVPAIVRQPLAERQKLEAAIIENVQREDLNPLETARAFAKLADEFGLPQREIAQRIGKSRETVSNTMRLLQLPSEAQRALQEGKISESHARIILSIQNPEKQRALLGEILSHHLTVRETEILGRRVLGVLPMDESRKMSLDELGNPMEAEAKNKLEEILGTKVEVKKKGARGKITINFFSEEEFNEILKKICKEEFPF